MLKFKLLLAVVILIIVGWSSAWFFGASMARKTIDAQMLGSGGQVSCGEDKIGGFPFRLYFDCQNATLVRDDLTYKLARIKASVVVTQPKLVVGFLQSPLEISDAFSGANYVFHWDEAKMSLRHDLSALQDGRLVIDNLRFTDRPDSTTDALSADLVSFFLQTRESDDGAAQSAGGRQTYAIYVGGDGVSIPVATIEKASIKIDLLATQLPALDGPLAGDFLRQWQRDGGNLTLKNMAVRIDDARLDATGVFSLNGQGLVNGLSEVTLVNFNTYLAATPLAPLTQGLFGLSSGSDTQQMSFAIRDGVVFVGPLPMMQLSPLF